MITTDELGMAPGIVLGNPGVLSSVYNSLLVSLARVQGMGPLVLVLPSTTLPLHPLGLDDLFSHPQVHSRPGVAVRKGAWRPLVWPNAHLDDPPPQVRPL